MPNMQHDGVLSINQQPVLPLTELPYVKKLTEIASMPIGAKMKSFQIRKANSLTKINSKSSGARIDLPNFAQAQSLSLDIFTDRVLAKSINFYAQSYNHASRFTPIRNKATSSHKRFWLRWLLLIGSTILLLPLLLQPSSQARDLLERAKIYLELDSSQAMILPNGGRYHLQDNQASLFNRAIGQARTIKPNSPFYQDAKTDIIRWSEVILDIAQGRASQKDFAGAIAAAKLIPQDDTSVSFIAQQATKSIERWQKRARQQKIEQYSLEEAKKLIHPTQASSYSQAIKIVRQLTPEMEGYQEAQTLTKQWSRQIYLIANYRASRGDFKQAIAAATLVPKDSPYYHGARNAIVKWKEFVSFNHS